MLPAILAALILTNGKIWTGDASMAAAMAIEGNRIIAVGSNATIAKLTTASDRVIDRLGRPALRGFIDNHTPFSEGVFELSRVQPRDPAPPQEFARRIVEYA